MYFCIKSSIGTQGEVGFFFFFLFIIKRYIGTQGEVGWPLKYFNPAPPPTPPPPGGLFYLPFEGGGPGVSLTLCCFVVYYMRRFVLCLPLCYFFLCFSVLLALRLPRLGKRDLVLKLFVRLFDLSLFGTICFLFLLVSGMGCSL